MSVLEKPNKNNNLIKSKDAETDLKMEKDNFDKPQAIKDDQEDELFKDNLPETKESLINGKESMLNEDTQGIDPDNYQPETVDFPDSPQPQTKRPFLRTQQFSDPLNSMANENNGLYSPSDDSLIDPCSSLPSYLNSEEYFEDSLMNETAGNDYSLNDSEVWARRGDPYPITAHSLIKEEPTSLQSYEPMSLQSNASLPDVELLGKIKDCFDQQKIKDLYVLSGRLQDMLSPLEIEEIVTNSEAYSGYIDDDMFEVLSAAHLEQSTGLSRTGSVRDSRRKIRPSISPMGNEDDIRIRAIFECHTNSLRSSFRRKNPPNENVKKFLEDSIVKSASRVQEETNEPFSLQDEENKLKSLNFEESLDDSDAMDLNFNLNPDDISQDNLTSDDNVKSEIKAERPDTLDMENTGTLGKRKIKVNPDIFGSDSHENEEDQKSLSSISNKSDVDVFSNIEDLVTPDDIETPEEMGDSIFGKLASTSEMIPELSAKEELQEERSWKMCLVGGIEQKIDMKVIEPYKKVLSHGGYFGPERYAVIVFSACYLPDHSRIDYDYVMDNLFLYVLTTLDQLVAEDYILVYLHGATDRNNMPTFGWLKRCYQMIDRRLRKNLKFLYLVHPTFWLKTIVIMTRPFISSKFYRKMKFIATLDELAELVGPQMWEDLKVCIPDKVKQLEFQIMINHKKKELKKKKKK